MQPPRDESTLGRAMDRLLDCGSPIERARILLDAVLEDGLAQAAGLWCHVGRGPVRAWHPLLSRGPASCLPTLAQVEAVVAGDLAPELALRGLVLTPPDQNDFALSLGEVDASEDRLAELEGLLSIWAAIERAEELSSADILDALPAPAPAEVEISAQIDELEQLLNRFVEDEPSRSGGGALGDVLEYELACRVGIDTEVRWRMDEVPAIGLGEEQLDDLVQNLLGDLTDGARRVRVELGPTPPDMPGALLVIESDVGWPPTLGGSWGTDGGCAGLPLAIAELAAAGGSLGIERSTWGGLRLTAWLPAVDGAQG